MWFSHLILTHSVPTPHNFSITMASQQDEDSGDISIRFAKPPSDPARFFQAPSRAKAKEGAEEDHSAEATDIEDGEDEDPEQFNSNAARSTARSDESSRRDTRIDPRQSTEAAQASNLTFQEAKQSMMERMTKPPEEQATSRSGGTDRGTVFEPEWSRVSEAGVGTVSSEQKQKRRGTTLYEGRFMEAESSQKRKRISQID